MTQDELNRFESHMAEFLKPQIEKTRQEGIAQGRREMAEEIFRALETAIDEMCGDMVIDANDIKSLRLQYLGKVKN